MSPCVEHYFILFTYGNFNQSPYDDIVLAEVYTNRSTGVDSGRNVNVSAGSGVINFELLQEQDPE